MDFRIRGEAGVLAESRNIVRKKNGGRGASSRGFVGRIGFFAFLFVGDATQVNGAWICERKRTCNAYHACLLPRGATVFLRGGTVLPRGGTALLRGGTVLLRGGTLLLRGVQYCYEGVQYF